MKIKLLLSIFLYFGYTFSVGGRTLNRGKHTTLTPTITATGTLPPLTTVYGKASVNDSISVSGNALTSGITATAPAGYELSTDKITYSASLVVGTVGTLTPTPVYIRITTYTNVAASPYNGTISLTSSGASTVNSPVISGTVTPLSIGLRLINVYKTYGLSIGTTYATGSVPAGANGEVISGVTEIGDAAAVSTTTPVGAPYTISISGATGSGTFLATNYTISYQTYSDTVLRAPVFITANDTTHTYGSSLPIQTGSTLFSATGLQNSEVIGSVSTSYLTGNSVISGAGLYANSVTAASATGGTFDPKNYSLVYLTGNLTVTPAPISIVGTTLKKYGTVLAGGSGSGAFSLKTGVMMNSDKLLSVSIAYGLGAAGNAAVNVYSGTATPSLATGNSSFNVNNYAITYISGDIFVVPKPIIVIASTYNKNFGIQLFSGPVSTGFTAPALANSETIGSVNMVYGTGASNTDPVGFYTGQQTPSAATGGTFTASNYSLSYTVGDIAVNKQVVTVSVSPAMATKTYGQGFTSGSGQTVYTTSGLQNGDLIGSITLTYGAGAANTDAAGTYINAVIPSLAIGGTFVPGNYTLNYVQANTLVLPAPLVITADTAFKVYGSSISGGAGSAAFTAPVLQNGETLSTVTITYGAGASPGNNAGAYTGSIVPSLATGTFAATNYAISYIASTLSVKPAPLTITATGISKIYGNLLTGAAGSSAFTYTAMVNGETLSSVSTAYGTGAAANAVPGPYTGSVTASSPQGSSTFLPANYDLTYVPATISVVPAPLTITAVNASHTYGTPLPGTGAGSTAFTSSGLAATDVIASVTLSYTNGNLATDPVKTYLNSAVITAATGSGFVTGNYTITYLPATLTVTPAALTIAASAVSKTYGTQLYGMNGYTAFTSTGMMNSELIGSVTSSYAAGASATSGVNLYPATISLNTATAGTFLAGNYSIVYTTGDLNVTPAPVTIGVPDITKVYGSKLSGPVNQTTFTSPGMQNGELITSVSIAYGAGSASNAAAGLYASSVTVGPATGTGFSASNYTFTYTPASIFVSPASLTITAYGPLKFYGSALAILPGSTSFTATSTVNSEVLTSVTMIPDLPGLAYNTPAGSPYSVRPSAAIGNAGFTASNYTIKYVGFNGMVSKAFLTITATGPSKSYGSSLSGSVNSSQFVPGPTAPGESITSINYTVNSAAQSASSPAGSSYTVTPIASSGSGGYLATNYTVSYIPFTGIISKAPLVVSAAAASKVYGVSLPGNSSAVAFTPTGLMNNETIGLVTLNYSAGSIATAPVNTYAGAISIAAASGGTFLASNYAVSYLAADLKVTPANLVVNANSLQKIYGSLLSDNVASTAFTSVGLQNNETIGTVSSLIGAGGPVTSPANTYTGASSVNSATGGSFLATNYTISYLPAAIIVNRAPLSVLPADLGKTYGTLIHDSTASLNYTISGLQNRETAGSLALSFGAGAASTAAVGTYQGSILASLLTGGSFNAGNYLISYFAGNLVVNQVPLNISPADVNKDYGVQLGNIPGSANFTASGLQNSETIGTVALSFTSGASSSSMPGTYKGSVLASAPTGGTFNPANYMLTYTPAALVVGTNTPSIAMLSQPDCSNGLGTFSIQNYNASYTYLISPSALVTGSGASFNAPEGSYTILATAPGSYASPASLVITVNPAPHAIQLLITNPAGVNAPGTVNLLAAAVTDGSDAGLVFSYFRDLSGNTPLVNPGTVGISGNYYLKATNSFGCSTSLKAIFVDIIPLPMLIVSNPPAVNDATPVDLTGSAVTAGSSPGLTFTYFTDSAATIPISEPGAIRVPGTYYIKAVNRGLNSVVKKVIVTIDYQVYIPNIFTPNGDGKNDVFEIVGIVHFPGSSLLIFNRWGNQIYHSSDYRNTWNGNGQAPGTYYYALTLNNKGISKVYKGWVQILH